MHVCIMQLNLIWYLLYINYKWQAAVKSSSTIAYFKNELQTAYTQ